MNCILYPIWPDQCTLSWFNIKPTGFLQIKLHSSLIEYGLCVRVCNKPLTIWKKDLCEVMSWIWKKDLCEVMSWKCLKKLDRMEKPFERINSCKMSWVSSKILQPAGTITDKSLGNIIKLDIMNLSEVSCYGSVSRWCILCRRHFSVMIWRDFSVVSVSKPTTCWDKSKLVSFLNNRCSALLTGIFD